MTRKLSVADAKREFSELMSRVQFRGERFIIERRGKPMAALVSVDDLKKIQSQAETPRQLGLIGIIGAWQDYPKLDDVISEIYNARKRAKDRNVKKL